MLTFNKQTNSSEPTTILQYFLGNNHNATDMQFIPLELVQSHRNSVRKAREVYLEPHGLNKKDES